MQVDQLMKHIGIKEMLRLSKVQRYSEFYCSCYFIVIKVDKFDVC